jgi:integrase/recombinase XerD
MDKSGTEALSVARPGRGGTPPPTNAGRRFPPEPLTTVEIAALLAAVPNRSSSGIRARALVGVLYGGGLRLAEALALYPRDVDTAGCTIRVREGKGRQHRMVGMDAHCCALLDRWLDRRRDLGLTGRHPVFATYEAGNVGQPLYPRYVRAALARYGARAGIDKRVHPHGLRHSLAFDLAQRGIPMHAIQAQLGHSSLAITDRYVRHLNPAAVIDLMRHRTWHPDDLQAATG